MMKLYESRICFKIKKGEVDGTQTDETGLTGCESKLADEYMEVQYGLLSTLHIEILHNRTFLQDT